MKKYLFFMTAVFLSALTGCATSGSNRPLLSGDRVIWVKDFVPLESIVVDKDKQRDLSDKIALMLDSRYSHKFSAIYRDLPPNSETSIVVSGVISDFGPGSTSDKDNDTDNLNTWMQRFGAGKFTVEYTVIDAASNEKLIDKAQINLTIYEDLEYFGWTRLEQTVNAAVEKIVRAIGGLKIKKL
jgi:hypothetical protein